MTENTVLPSIGRRKKPWPAKLIAPSGGIDGASLLRTEFRLKTGHGAVVHATLKLTAQGVVEAWLNGTAVSKDLLTPGWSAYEWRLRYATYNVADLISDQTVLGLQLGNGWAGGRFGWAEEGSWYGDQIGALAQLEVTFEDGEQQLIITDENWTSAPSDVRENDLYDGQTIDARMRDEAWKRPGFTHPDWAAVATLPFDTTKLEPYVGPPVRRWITLPVRQVSTSPSGKTIVDFGQNLVGWVKARVQGAAGTEITIRHAEVLERGELATEPLRTARATDRYILSGGVDEFEPTFTFHGFRYAEITGWPGELDPDQLIAVAISSDLERIGHFTTSDALLNRFHENVLWSTRGNFLDLPTDCPQRDERLGWTGDIAVFAPAAAFLFDVNAFLSDWLIDLAIEQEHQDGIVTWTVPDVYKYLPENSWSGPVNSTAIWSDAAVWVPWAIYQAYGDITVLQRQFDPMAAHIRRVQTLLTPSGVWEGNFQFGDWLDPDAPADQPTQAKADPGVVATACAYHSANIVAQIAGLLGHQQAAEEFGRAALNLRTAFNREYVDAGTVRSDCTTVYSLAVVFDLLDTADEEVAGRRLAQLVQDSGYRISTGFAGTPFITDALTRTGHLDAAYRLLMERSCPSWLYPVDMGATTIWERWDSQKPDGTINSDGMTSFNHYALGAVADWMHRVVGGIAPLQPGYAKVLIAPQPGGGLTHAETTLQTPHGLVRVHWRLKGDRFIVRAEVPDGVDAILRLPGQDDETFSGRVERESTAPLDGAPVGAVHSTALDRDAPAIPGDPLR